MATCKFIHAADIHLDSPLRGLSRDPDAPADSLRSACREAFKNLVELALMEKVEFVVLAGDLYDGDWQDYHTGIFLIEQVAKLGRRNIDVYSASGNHDAANKMTKTLPLPQNMKVFSSTQAQTFIHEPSKVALHGQSYRSEAVTDNLVTGYPDSHPGRLNIGVLHTSLDGREGHAPYAPCSLDDLRAKGYQYWALGHVHTREVVDETSGYALFPGCLQGRNIREVGPKGCTLVTVEDHRIKRVEEKHVDVIRWFVCDVGLTGTTSKKEVLERVRQSMTEQHQHSANRPMVMRIKLRGESEVARELAAYPEKLTYEIKALGAEVAGLLGCEIWIEKIENKTKPVSKDSRSSVDHEALGYVLEKVRNPAYGIKEIQGLEEKIRELTNKLPHPLSGKYQKALRGDGSSSEELQTLVEEGKDMLEGQLLGRRGLS